MIFNGIDLDTFIDKIEEKTLNDEMNWDFEKYSKSKYLERSTNFEKINSVYLNKNKNGDILAIGSFDRRVSRNEDDYYYEDVYFLSISDRQSNEVVTFVDQDDLSMSFQINLGKLYRIIQIKSSGVAEKIDRWFD